MGFEPTRFRIAPFGPRNPYISLGATCKLIPSTARGPFLKTRVSASTCIDDDSDGIGLGVRDAWLHGGAIITNRGPGGIRTHACSDQCPLGMRFGFGVASTRSSSARAALSERGREWSAACNNRCSRPDSRGSSPASCSAAPIAARTCDPSGAVWPVRGRRPLPGIVLSGRP